MSFFPQTPSIDRTKWKVKTVQAGALAVKLAGRDATGRLYGAICMGNSLPHKRTIHGPTCREDKIRGLLRRSPGTRPYQRRSVPRTARMKAAGFPSSGYE